MERQPLHPVALCFKFGQHGCTNPILLPSADIHLAFPTGEEVWGEISFRSGRGVER